MGRLKGKRALVTGAGGGIGQGIALELAREGAEVAVHYGSNAEGAESTRKKIAEMGQSVYLVQGDLGILDQCFRVVDEAASLLGGLDILVNNAGITEKTDFLDVTPEQYEKIFNVNFRSQFFCCRQAARLMKESGRGSIVNISSIHAFGGVPGNSVYAATKGAIVAFTRELAVELIPYRIRVNAVAPGHVEVARHWTMPHYSREYGERIVPWGRVGTPEDIGKATAFLVSDDADFILGQVLYVDGGTTVKLNLSSSAAGPAAKG